MNGVVQVQFVWRFLNFSFFGLDLNILSASVLGVKEVLPNSQPVYEDQTYLQSQTGTTLLDKFTYCLLVKCSAEVCSLLNLYDINMLNLCRVIK